jgi:hypothetical protein
MSDSLDYGNFRLLAETVRRIGDCDYPEARELPYPTLARTLSQEQSAVKTKALHQTTPCS